MAPQISHSTCRKSPVSFQYATVQDVLILILNPFQNLCKTCICIVSFAFNKLINSVSFYKTKTCFSMIELLNNWFPLSALLDSARTSIKTSCFTNKKIEKPWCFTCKNRTGHRVLKQQDKLEHFVTRRKEPKFVSHEYHTHAHGRYQEEPGESDGHCCAKSKLGTSCTCNEDNTAVTFFTRFYGPETAKGHFLFQS